MRIYKAVGLLTACSLLAGCMAEAQDVPQETFSLESETAAAEETYDADAVMISLNGTSASADGPGVLINGTVLTITAPGTYVFSGTLNQGTIIVDTAEKGTVHLVLKNAEIHSTDNRAVQIKQAEEAILTAYQGTENTIESTGENHAIEASGGLLMNGSGTLNITSGKDGIHTDGSLEIDDAILNINGSDDGIQSEQQLTIRESILSIQAAKDGLKTGNDAQTDDCNIVLDGGMINIDAGDDCIQAAGSVVTSEEGTYSLTAKGTSQDEESSRGIDASGSVDLNGAFTIDASDDAIHADQSIVVHGGTYDISAGDDALHADETIQILNGTMTVSKSNEGIEASDISIEGGTIDITAADDGINAVSADADSKASVNVSDGSMLAISEGTVTIHAQGDGMDSNGDIKISSGTITIYGPESERDGAVDCNGSFLVNGGILIAGGSSGMLQLPSSDSACYSIAAGIQDNSGTVELKDREGNVIASYTSDKQYETILFSGSMLKEGETYTLVENGRETGSVTITSPINTLNLDNRTQRAFSPHPLNKEEESGSIGSFLKGFPALGNPLSHSVNQGVVREEHCKGIGYR